MDFTDLPIHRSWRRLVQRVSELPINDCFVVFRPVAPPREEPINSLFAGAGKKVLGLLVDVDRQWKWLFFVKRLRINHLHGNEDPGVFLLNAVFLLF